MPEKRKGRKTRRVEIRQAVLAELSQPTGQPLLLNGNSKGIRVEKIGSHFHVHFVPLSARGNERPTVKKLRCTSGGREQMADRVVDWVM